MGVVALTLWPGLLGFVLNGMSPNTGFSPSSLPGGFGRWSMAPTASGDEGLGGGLSYIISDDFCASLLPKFPERNLVPLLNLESVPALQFVFCSDIKAAIERGFATWAMNHKSLSFSNIGQTSACAGTSYAGLVNDTCPWEVFVGVDDGETLPALAAYVVNHRRSEVASNWWQHPMRAPSGVVSTNVNAHARSVMRFQTHLCWYMDATFCWYFQFLSEVHGWNVLLVGRCVLLGVFGLAALRLASVLFWCVVAMCCLGKQTRDVVHGEDEKRGRGGCWPGCSACLDYVSALNPCLNIFVLFLLVFPPVFYWQIFMPCFECYDFEAAAAHEMGHVLGFGHPDEWSGRNLVGDCAMANATCRDPFGACGRLQNYSAAEASIMESMTRRNSRTCLSDHDLEGLHLLYPTCDGSQPLEVACTKTRILSGWLRLAITTGVPFLGIVLLILTPLTCLRCRDQRRLKRKDKQIADYRTRLDEALKEAAKKRLIAPVQERLHANANRPGTALHKISKVASSVQRPSIVRRQPSGGRGELPRGEGGRGARGAKAAKVTPVEAYTAVDGNATKAPQPSPAASTAPPPQQPAAASRVRERRSARRRRGRRCAAACRRIYARRSAGRAAWCAPYHRPSPRARQRRARRPNGRRSTPRSPRRGSPISRRHRCERCSARRSTTSIRSGRAPTLTWRRSSPAPASGG